MKYIYLVIKKEDSDLASRVTLCGAFESARLAFDMRQNYDNAEKDPNITYTVMGTELTEKEDKE